MENSQDTDKGMCLSCIGTGVIYDGDANEYFVCVYCNGTGQASPEENESYLSTINLN